MADIFNLNIEYVEIPPSPEPLMEISIDGQYMTFYPQQTDEEVASQTVAFLKEALAEARKRQAEKAKIIKGSAPTPIEDIFAGLP